MNIKYEKGLYLGKIAELEGYHTQLGNHLATMETLRGKMFSFWDDPQARKAGEMLVKEIRTVRNVMSQTMTELTMLKSIVEKQTGVEQKQDQEIDVTLRTLDTVANFLN